ncbi:MAG: HDOD domain-containing protein [Planctomycetaceae bacterium]|nr:HDOD domain-containing protein [Planctomycetaceae bacterium]
MDWSELRQQLLGNSKEIPLPPNFRLPILPSAVNEFTRKSSDPETSPAVLGKILETDAGLTVDLLQLVNSSVFSLRSKASSVKHAIAMLGVSRTRNFVLTTAVQRAMAKNQSKLINLTQFWSANLEKALFAREIAVLMNVDPDTAYSAGMLQDFMLPALTSALFDQYSQFVDHQSKEPQLLTIFEQKHFQWDHAVVAAHIAHQWAFPDDLVCCLHQHHLGLKVMLDPQLSKTVVVPVAISALLPDPLHQVPDGIPLLEKLEQAWPAFKLEGLAQKVEADFLEMGGQQAHHISFRKRLEKHRAK